MDEPQAAPREALWPKVVYWIIVVAWWGWIALSLLGDYSEHPERTYFAIGGGLAVWAGGTAWEKLKAIERRLDSIQRHLDRREARY